MKLGAWLGFCSVVLVVSATACEYPDFGFRPSGGSGGTGVVGGSNPGGTGPGGTGGTVTGTGGTQTGTGATSAGTPTGTGGTGGGPCDLYAPGVCGGGEKCTVVNESTGATGCVTAGPRPAWARCDNNEQCVEGTWCDHENLICKPICQDTNNCPIGGDCLAAAASGGGGIPGLAICTSHCDPLNANSCNQQHGETVCAVSPAGIFDCYASGGMSGFDICSVQPDCARGLLCVTPGLCASWCAYGFDPCGILTDCIALDPEIFYEGTQLGFCG